MAGASMNRRLRRAMCPGLMALAGVITLSTGARAQQAVGDSAWLAGDFHAARIAYERELAANPDSPRANFRLGILASWDGRLDSALVLIRRARAVEPRDPDLLVSEARVLAWAGRYDDAIRQYDSALVFSPEHAEAATGRALVLAWSGELGAAIRRYHAVLDRDPDNVRALTGLAQAYQWQGRPHLARSYVSRAREADPTDRDARELERRILATLRPRVELRAGFSDDSDDNLAYWQTGTLSSYLSEGLSGFLTVGALEASDPVRDATRLMVEGGASWARGDLHLTGALGARRLNPDSGSSRTAPTYRASVSYRLHPRAGVGIGYSHYPFDETALLIGRDLDLDVLETTADVTLRRGLLLGAGGGHAWLSDDNTRTWGIVALTQTIRRDFFVGAMGRVLSYDRVVAGYFSPDRFSVIEGRAGYAHEGPRWIARLSGGLGAQQIGRGASAQTVWHVETRLGRIWNVVNRIEFFGTLTNSAESSTTGAFRYGSAGVVIRLGL